MGNSIRLSSKHGVNPTIPICFWCGREKNEIALLGKLKGDKEAPRNAIINYEPCDDCAAMFEKGILVIGVTEIPPHENALAIQRSGNVCLYPTGAFFVGTEQWAMSFFDESHINSILAQKKVLMDDGFVRSVVAQHEKEEGE